MTFTPWEQMSRRDQLASTHYDMYKDVHGIRPRWIDYSAMTEEDLEKELEQLERELVVEMERERAREAAAIEKFEVMITKMITKMIAKEKWQDRESAIKGLMTKRGCREGDRDYLCFLYGLPYRYLDKKDV